ncbi:unnamed protein product [Linum tenue]|uniref:CCHC-type domain-containing protein n=1 Tax=Linum tenue TaxID=586396 RepID=A0AAV0MFS9_9ROSI|nr:unnamed protein product [Linum tenue]
MIVWVQLPALKIHFYHKEVLTMLGNLIGRTIKLDYHTLTQQRAKFARLAVEVDISKALVPRIWLDDEWQKVEYENLPEVCFKCGKIGHNIGTCPQIVTVASLPQGKLDGNPVPAGPSPSSEDPNPGFGPWKLVTRNSRRNSGDMQRKGKGEQDAGTQLIVSKNGNRGAAGKEANQTLPILAPTNDPSHQHNRAQERKVSNGKKSADDGKKGKGKAINDTAGKAKGLLGPGPNSEACPKSPRQIVQEGASTSHSPPGSSVGLVTRLKSPDAASGLTAQKPAAGPPQPPIFRSVLGPNGTLMQIVDNPLSPIDSSEPIPSLTARTKRNKSKKTQGKRSPTKLNPMKPLQIWSPVKKRKPKSNSRLASLTLQEINAWTEAAKRPPNGDGEKVSIGLDGQVQEESLRGASSS